MSRLLALVLSLLLAVAVSAPPAAAQAKSKETPAKADPRSPAKPAKKHEPIDLNTATAGELETLPGIGHIDANKIIANRPYTRADELVRKNVIPERAYEQIKDHVTVGRRR